jgi:cytochrome c553
MRVLIASVLVFWLSGCNDTQTTSPKQTESKEMVKSQAKVDVKEKQPKGIENTVAPARTITGKSLYMKCTSCHGMDASKKALGKSKVIRGWSIEKLTKAIKGYQDGSYGGDMKSVMKGQVKDFNAVDIHILSEYISKL